MELSINQTKSPSNKNQSKRIFRCTRTRDGLEKRQGDLPERWPVLPTAVRRALRPAHPDKEKVEGRGGARHGALARCVGVAHGAAQQSTMCSIDRGTWCRGRSTGQLPRHQIASLYKLQKEYN